MKKNLTITSIIIAIIFGSIFLPKIYNRLKSETVVDSSRTKEVSNDSKLAFVKLNGEARKVPDFIFKNSFVVSLTKSIRNNIKTVTSSISKYCK